MMLHYYKRMTVHEKYSLEIENFCDLIKMVIESRWDCNFHNKRNCRTCVLRILI